MKLQDKLAGISDSEGIIHKKLGHDIEVITP